MVAETGSKAELGRGRLGRARVHVRGWGVAHEAATSIVAVGGLIRACARAGVRGELRATATPVCVARSTGHAMGRAWRTTGRRHGALWIHFGRRASRRQTRTRTACAPLRRSVAHDRERRQTPDARAAVRPPAPPRRRGPRGGASATARVRREPARTPTRRGRGRGACRVGVLTMHYRL